MIRKGLVLACVLACVGRAVAQPPQEIDPDLLGYIEEIEYDTGTTRFGLPFMGELEDGASEVVTVKVDPSTYTFITLICGPSCEEISGAALDADGVEIAKAPRSDYDAVIQLPPGNGDTVQVRVNMDSCDWDGCPYAIQTFTRPAG